MELGSEYPWPEGWEREPEEGKPGEGGGKALSEPFAYEDRLLVFSGRTAIEQVLKDIRGRKKAFLPSYCCQSMIDPFLRSGRDVCFYGVNVREGRLDIWLEIPKEAGILLWCSYFGFSHRFPGEEIERFRRRGGIVIEDITHSFLSERPVWTGGDYYIASLRKWGPMVCGGAAYKREGRFVNRELSRPSEWFLKTKESAMRRKRAYLLGGNEEEKGVKEVFLEEYRSADRYFDECYEGKGMDETSLALTGVWYSEKTRTRRRENAGILYKALKGAEKLEFLFPEEEADCPLFVSVLIKGGQRDRLRRRLAERGIYCPAHWPRPAGDGAVSNLYGTELSLICDQRYGQEEIKRMAEAVKEELEIVSLTEGN